MSFAVNFRDVLDPGRQILVLARPGSFGLGPEVAVKVDIASSLAPEVTSSYVTIWVRVGVNRARALYDIVVSSVFHTFLFCSIEFQTMYPASFS